MSVFGAGRVVCVGCGASEEGVGRGLCAPCTAPVGIATNLLCGVLATYSSALSTQGAQDTSSDRTRLADKRESDITLPWAIVPSSASHPPSS